MKTIEECLDIILRELVKNWEKPNNERLFLRGEKLLKEFDLPQTMQKHEFFKRLIDKLVKDGYAELPQTELAWFELDHYQRDTLITIEGYFFINEGGYVSQNKRNATLLRRQSLDAKLIVIGTFAAGLFAFVEIGKILWKLFWPCSYPL